MNCTLTGAAADGTYDDSREPSRRVAVLLGVRRAWLSSEHLAQAGDRPRGESKPERGKENNQNLT